MSAIISGIALVGLGLFACYLVVVAVVQLTNLVRSNRLYDTERALMAARIGRLNNRFARLDLQMREHAWSGFRKFVLAGKVLEGEQLCSLYFTPHDGQPLPPYLPGQYLTFSLQLPGRDKPVTRCYSLSDSPTHPDYYRVTVKRITAGERGEDGLVSTFLHQQLEPGELVDVKAPAGGFHLDPEHQGPVVLTGGGVGITPMLSMLSYLCATGSKRETWFFYGVTHGGEHIMREYLRRLVDEHENVHLHICYSRPREHDREHTDYDHAERVSVDLFRRLLPSNNYDFYTCGPPAMMDQITHELEAWGVPKTSIHFEAFGAATVQRVQKDVAPSVAGDPIEVVFARSDRTVPWDGAYPTLLELAEASGITMESGCRAGNCGSCQTAVRRGSVAYLNEPGAAVDEGSCLTCISVPRGTLVLDA